MKNNKIDYFIFTNRFNIILWILNTIINLFNKILLHDKFISGYVIGIYSYIIISSLILMFIVRHNNKVILNLYKEMGCRYYEENSDNN